MSSTGNRDLLIMLMYDVVAWYVGFFCLVFSLCLFFILCGLLHVMHPFHLKLRILHIKAPVIFNMFYPNVPAWPCTSWGVTTLVMWYVVMWQLFHNFYVNLLFVANYYTFSSCMPVIVIIMTLHVLIRYRAIFITFSFT